MYNRFAWHNFKHCSRASLHHLHPILPYSSYFQKRPHIQVGRPHKPMLRNTAVMEKNRELAKRCEDVTKTSVYANVGLVIIKGTAGFMTNSMALIADATHSLTDLISDFMTYFTIKYSQRSPTRKFPLGFGKIDTMGALPVAALLTFASYHIVTRAANKLYLVYLGTFSASTMMITMPYLAIGTIILSLVVKEWLYRITITAGNEYQSNVIIANAWHHRSDAYTSLIALIGVCGSFIGYPILDPVCGTLIGLYLLKIAFDLSKISFLQLLDTNSDNAMHLNLINDIISKCDGIEDVHDLIVTYSGQYIHIQTEIGVDQWLNMNQVQDIVNNVKLQLYANEMLNIQNLAVIPIPYHQHMDMDRH